MPPSLRTEYVPSSLPGPARRKLLMSWVLHAWVMAVQVAFTCKQAAAAGNCDDIPWTTYTIFMHE